MILPRRLYRTASGEFCEEDDVRQAFVYGPKGRVIPDAEAERIGLYNQVVPSITELASATTTLAERLAILATAVRTAIDTSDRLGDKDTADLFTQISRSVDNDLCFVEAHLQA